jgi:hypothetical protein
MNKLYRTPFVVLPVAAHLESSTEPDEQAPFDRCYLFSVLRIARVIEGFLRLLLGLTFLVVQLESGLTTERVKAAWVSQD